MSNIILEGVLQTFDKKHNGRIYPKESFDKAMKHVYNESVRKLIRKKKINKIFNDKAREI